MSRAGVARAVRASGLVVSSVVLAACGQVAEPAVEPAVGPGRDAAAADAAPTPRGVPEQAPRASPSPASSTDVAPADEPRTSLVSVPALGLVDVPVRRYRGTPDDAPGTRIQDTGVMASPRGSSGLVGPGEVGNYLVTGHRTSHGAPLADLPALRRGQQVRVRSGDRVLVYRVTGTRLTSFRSPASLRAQSAAVPGRPGVRAERAMLTLSTCRTPEDRAEGNYWSDEHGNPEHRIDKIAVLESVRPARGA